MLPVWSSQDVKASRGTGKGDQTVSVSLCRASEVREFLSLAQDLEAVLASHAKVPETLPWDVLGRFAEVQGQLRLWELEVKARVVCDVCLEDCLALREEMPSLHGLYVADGQPVPLVLHCYTLFIPEPKPPEAEVFLEGLRLHPRALCNLQARRTHSAVKVSCLGISEQVKALSQQRLEFSDYPLIRQVSYTGDKWQCLPQPRSHRPARAAFSDGVASQVQ